MENKNFVNQKEISNFYLKIAVSVLKIRRRPLSASAIIEDAYREYLMPHHLYGKTQEKTLQSQISRDILKKGENSLFYRTAPGRFFLREFIVDSNIPDEYKNIYIAKRRAKDISKYPFFSFNKGMLKNIKFSNNRRLNKYILNNISIYSKDDSVNFRIKTFCIVRRGRKVLSFTVGHMKNYDNFSYDKKSIGFFSYLEKSSKDLFSVDGCGIIERGLQTINEDLGECLTISAKLDHFKLVTNSDGILELVAIIHCRIKESVNIFNRNLSVKRIQWLDLDKSSETKFFEPLSQKIIDEMRSKK